MEAKTHERRRHTVDWAYQWGVEIGKEDREKTEKKKKWGEEKNMKLSISDIKERGRGEIYTRKEKRGNIYTRKRGLKGREIGKGGEEGRDWQGRGREIDKGKE